MCGANRLKRWYEKQRPRPISSISVSLSIQPTKLARNRCLRPGAYTVVVSSRALPAPCAAGGGCPMQDEEGYMIRDPRLEAGAPLIEPAELRRDGSRLGEDSSCTLAFLKRSIESAPGKSARVARMARSPTPPTIPPPGTSPCTGPSTIRCKSYQYLLSVHTVGLDLG